MTVEKTNKDALVPISATLRAVLTQRKARPVVSEFVLVNPEGHRYPDSVIDRYHRMAKAIAGITRRVRIHDLRHTFGSTLASGGASELQLQSFFGHASTAMVKRYSRPSVLRWRSLPQPSTGPKSDPMEPLLEPQPQNRQCS